MNRTSPLQSLVAGGKVAQGVQMLTGLARQLGPGAKLPTVRELCRQMQVSQATLDAALDELELRGLVNRKQGSGLYVSQSIGMRRIGLVTPSLAGDQSTGLFYRLLMEAMRMECRDRDDLLTYYVFDAEHDRTGHGPQHLKTDIENKRVDGLVIAGLNPEQADQAQAMGVPHVTFCAALNRTPRVDPDYHSLITRGVQALVRCEHRRIAFAYPNFARVWESIPFVEVFQRAMREAGATAQAKWLIAFDVDSVLRPLDGSRQLHRLWAAADRPDAILSMNDEVTAGVLHAAEVLGVRIPQDLLVASHANAGAELFGKAEVIRIECDPAKIAQACLRMLDESLDGKPVVPVKLMPPCVRMIDAARSRVQGAA